MHNTAIILLWALSPVLLVSGMAFGYVLLTSIIAAILSPPFKLTPQGLLSFFREVRVQLIVFIMMPIDHLKPSWKARDHDKEEALAIILPGYTDTVSLFSMLHQAFDKHDIAYRTIRYTPFFGELDHLAQHVADLIHQSRYKKHVLVAHSMGGLIAERCNDLLHGTDKEIGIIHVGTPFHGTYVAHLAARPCGTDMLPKSDFIRSLRYHPAHRISIHSKYDNVVVPRSSALAPIPVTEQISVDDWRHNGLLFNPTVIDRITRTIQSFRQEGQFL